MSEHDDEYLWSGQGSASEDVAVLERSLAPLRWRPQSLVLPSTQAEAEIIGLEEARERRSANWWPMVVGGLVAAAAVLALSLWAKPDAAVHEAAPTINPTAPPTSPDLKDPFGPRDPAGFTDPITDPETPIAPTVSPDLKDPFAGPSDAPELKPRPRDSSSDLKNPFKDSPRASDRSEDLRDPFGDRPDEPPTTSSPDLKDPFAP